MPSKESSVNIPPCFWEARYNAACFPGMLDWKGLEGGANCQQFAYELLRHYGLTVPDLRSKELWEDGVYSDVVADFQPLDLLLFNRTSDPWGAHVAVFVGCEETIHLAKKIGSPVIWTVQHFLQQPEYSCLIGAKRIKR